MLCLPARLPACLPARKKRAAIHTAARQTRPAHPTTPRTSTSFPQTTRNAERHRRTDRHKQTHQTKRERRKEKKRIFDGRKVDQSTELEVASHTMDATAVVRHKLAGSLILSMQVCINGQASTHTHGGQGRGGVVGGSVRGSVSESVWLVV